MKLKEFFGEQFNASNVKFELSFQDLKLILEYMSAQNQPVDSIIEPLLTTDEVCEIFKVDSTTIWRWRKVGYLPNIMVGSKVRFRRVDVLSIIEEEGEERAS